MPIYEYQCERCGNIQEKLLIFSGDTPEPPECEKCYGVMKKVVSSGSFKFAEK